jgi:hypothetical protein
VIDNDKSSELNRCDISMYGDRSVRGPVFLYLRLEEYDMEFMTAREVADDFFAGKWNYQKVLRLARQGKLPGKKVGKSYLFERRSLEVWVQHNFSNPAWAKIKV